MCRTPINSVKVFNYAQAITNSKERIGQNEYFSIIDNHAKLIKAKQEDKTISLDYISYKKDQEDFKLQSDKLKVIEEFNSPYLFEWNDNNLNLNSSYNDDMKEKRDRWIESLQKDIYVDEAMNLLKDLSSFKGNDIISQIKID